MKKLPYWWEAAPRPDQEVPQLPGQVDVLIVGSGVARASFFGARLGHKMLGDVEKGATFFVVED